MFPSLFRSTCILFLVISYVFGQSQKPDDKTACTRLGAPSTADAPVGCSWNQNVLQNGFSNFECEPSQLWMEYKQSSNFQSLPLDCDENDATTCKFQDDDTCLISVGQQQNSSASCYDPPLIQLKSVLSEFVATVPHIRTVIDDYSRECYTKINNSTCSLSPFCVWTPEYPDQVEIKDFEPSTGETEREVQSVSILYPEQESVSEVQEVSIQAGEYNSLVNTITTMAGTNQQISGGLFKLSLRGSVEETSALGHDSSASEIQNAIQSGLAGSLGAVSVQVSSVGSHSRGRASWEVTFSGPLASATPSDPVPQLEVASQALTYTGASTAPPVIQVLVTRHPRTRQRIALYSNATLVDTMGTFTLTFTQPTYEIVEVLETAVTLPIAWTSSAAELQSALEALTISGEDALELVHVESVSVLPHTKRESDGLFLRKAWDVVFAGTLQEYEFGEHELLPEWYANGCDAETCQDFAGVLGATEHPTASPVVSPTSAPSTSPSAVSLGDLSVSPTLSPTQGEFIRRETQGTAVTPVVVDITTETTKSAPRVHGSFFLEYCKFESFLPGLLLATSESNQLVSSCQLNVGEDVNIGDIIKVAGQQFAILEIQSGSGPPGDCWPGNYTGFGSSITVGGLFNSYLPPGTNETGLDGLVCSYETSRTFSHSMRAQGSEFTSTVRQRLRDLTNLEVQVSRTGPSYLGEYSWQITFETEQGAVTSPEEIPLLRWKPAEGTRQLRGEGATVAVQKLRSGVAPPSGTFRLAFAGYDGEVSMYESLRNLHLEEQVELGPNRNVGGVFVVDDNGVVYQGGSGPAPGETDGATSPPTIPPTEEGSNQRIVAFSLPLPVATGGGVLEDGLESMANVLRDGIRVTRESVSLTVNATGARWSGVEWTVTFLTDSVQLLDLDIKDIEKLDADLPLLSPFSVLPLKGSGARLIISPVQDGTGKLFQTTTAEVVEFARDSLDTPCVANATLIGDELGLLGLTSSKIEALSDLDEYMLRCAKGTRTSTAISRLPSQEECKGVTVSEASSDAADADAEEESSIPLCVWRGNSIYNETLYPNPGFVDDRKIINDFFDMEGIYQGRSSLIRYSGCTVPLTYFGQQIVKVFSLSDKQQEYIQSIIDGTETNLDEEILLTFNSTRIPENKALSRDLVVLLNQFQTCTSNDLLELRIPATQFIEVWQYVVTFTCYTCGIAYGVGGTWLAYRMKRITLSFRDLGWTVLIAFLGVFLGGMIGFLAGSLPAALISQIYSSIPHNLSTESAISLGVSLGLMLLYFDLGRGSNVRIE